MPVSHDYYSILGLNRSASADQIKAAYRKLAREHHPDVNSSQDAEQRFAEVCQAYEVLSDPKKRALYDRTGSLDPARHGRQGPTYSWSNVAGNQPMDQDDIGSMFETFFGGRQGSPFGTQPQSPQPRRGQDLRHAIDIDFLTAVQGGEESLTLSLSGIPRSIAVTIPAGIAQGAKLRIRGEGQPSPTGAAPGDLILTVHTRPSPVFTRGSSPADALPNSPHLWIEVPITLGEAALGATVSVPTIEGPVELTIPPGSPSGTRLRLAQRGITPAKGAQGDLFAILKLVPPDPDDLDSEDRDALERLRPGGDDLRHLPGWPD